MKKTKLASKASKHFAKPVPSESVLLDRIGKFEREYETLVPLAVKGLEAAGVVYTFAVSYKRKESLKTSAALDHFYHAPRRALEGRFLPVTAEEIGSTLDLKWRALARYSDMDPDRRREKLQADPFHRHKTEHVSFGYYEEERDMGEYNNTFAFFAFDQDTMPKRLEAAADTLTREIRKAVAEHGKNVPQEVRDMAAGLKALEQIREDWYGQGGFYKDLVGEISERNKTLDHRLKVAQGREKIRRAREKSAQVEADFAGLMAEVG